MISSALVGQQRCKPNTSMFNNCDTRSKALIATEFTVFELNWINRPNS